MKNVSQKTYFFSLVTSRTYSIKLTANWKAHIDREDPGLSVGYLAIVLASIVIDIIAIFCENSPILRKFDIFWPLRPQIWPDQKMIWEFFCRTCGGLSNTVYRLSLSFLVFELSGGGGICPPGPPWCSLGSWVAKTHFKESNFEWYSRIDNFFGYLKSPSYQIYVHAGLIYKCRKSGHFLSRHMWEKWAFSTQNFKWGWLAVISCKLLTLHMKILLEACYVWCGVKQNCIFICVPVICQFLNILHSQFFIKQPLI